MTLETQSAVRAIRDAKAALARDIAYRLKDFTETTGVRISDIQVNHWDTFGGTLDYTVDIEVAL